MVLQVYGDESGTQKGNFVVAGYIGTAAEWAKFSAEWEPLAKKFGRQGREGHYAFHMSDMMAFRRGDIAPFYRCIENHKVFPVCFGINERSYKRALGRLTVPGHDLSALGNAFTLLFFCFVSNVTRIIDERKDLFPPDGKIDFYFDDRKEKGLILREWDRFTASSSEKFRNRLGPAPRFEDDNDFMPLQAADFWAWWNSHWLDIGKIDDFGGLFEIHKGFEAAHHYLTEDEAVAMLKKIIRHHVPNAIIYENRIPDGDKR